MKKLNRDVIKYIAMLTMFLNHFEHTFLQSGTILSEIFRNIGYFTAPVMCYFLVEGYQYTSSKKKYGLRLFIFALISQIPFSLLFGMGGSCILSLFLGFLILLVKEKVSNKFLKVILFLLLLFASMFCDWPLLAPLLILMIAYAWGKKIWVFLSYVVIATMMFGFNAMTPVIKNISPVALRIGVNLLENSVIVIAGLVVVYFYSGKRAEKGQAFSKWFFYVFYPLHITILYLASLYI
ncbi:MAG: TraX family protein [Eubacteriales bacterium]|nr:TraX family protein [Eubacteriales bacterium]